MSFENLGLRPELLRALLEKGYNKPTRIQSEAIPVALDGRDIMAGAQTGTGKTAAFTLPMLQRLMESEPQKKHKPVVRALILTPTRELAAQVQESVYQYGRLLPLKSAAIFGGAKIYPQIQKLRRGVDILVATPGRLLDHVNQKNVDLSKVEIFVLDEADRMLDMGFIPDIRKIMGLMSKKRQNLLFFATFSDEVKRLANSLLKSPALIEVARRNTAAESVTQVVHPVDASRKTELLSFLIGSNNWKQVLVFTRTKRGAERLAEKLERDGLRTTAIHGDKKQGARTKALDQFKRGVVRVLVATDVASRGLNIDQLPHVVNFELPTSPEDYVHRIGRTGRAGKEGEAISLVSVDEMKLLQSIERLLKKTIRQVVVPDFEPDPSIRPKAIAKKGRGFAKGGKKRFSDSGFKRRSPARGRQRSDSSDESPRRASGSGGRKRFASSDESPRRASGSGGRKRFASSDESPRRASGSGGRKRFASSEESPRRASGSGGRKRFASSEESPRRASGSGGRKRFASSEESPRRAFASRDSKKFGSDAKRKPQFRGKTVKPRGPSKRRTVKSQKSGDR